MLCGTAALSQALILVEAPLLCGGGDDVDGGGWLGHDAVVVILATCARPHCRTSVAALALRMSGILSDFSDACRKYVAPPSLANGNELTFIE